MTLAPAVAPAAGDLDEYRLIRVLGQGGMGTVYLAHDQLLDRDVALKLVTLAPGDSSARARFLTEARAIARLNHPNVVAVHRAGVTRGGQPYLVQELLRGTSLAQLPRPVEVSVGLTLARDVARGLAAAHRASILHRDVKPANVMVGDGGVAKLVDFGIASIGAGPESPPVVALPARDDDVARTADPVVATAATVVGKGPATVGPRVALDPTATGVAVAPRDTTATTASGDAAPDVAGTPRYLAPELWRGQPATPASDVFGFGALLHELATAAPAYPQRQLEELRAAIVDGEPAAMTDDTWPLAYRALVAACLARDPAARPSAERAVVALERMLDGTPPIPDGNPYPGLAPFEASHRAVFFGRQGDVSAIVDRLRAGPIVTVTGDSGIGKSSVCRAGVVAAIERGDLGDGRTWSATTVALGRRPLAALRDRLGLDDDAASTAGALVQALGVDRSHGRLVFVDQLEELATLAEPDQASAAAELLARLAGDLPGVKVLLAVRGDFVTRVAAITALHAPLTRGLFLLRRLGADELRAAITEPAAAKGVHFADPSTVAALVASVTANVDALPLVQFTLAQLWSARDDATATIPAAALAALGGVEGSLARYGDGLIAGLPAAERAAARRLLVALVTRERTRAWREREELVADDDRAAAAALEALVRGRLIVAQDTPSGAAAYQLAHEALVSAWSTLDGWLDVDREVQGLRRRLSVAADEWHRLGRPRELLWPARQLRAVAALDELAPRDRAFVDHSRGAIRRRRWRLGLAVAAVPLVVAVTWWRVTAREDANRERVVQRHRAVAARAAAGAGELERQAVAARAEAFAAFDADRTLDGERAWQAARVATASARTALRDAGAELEAALARGGQRADVRAHLADVIVRLALLAELDDDRPAVGELVRRLAAYDDGTRLAWWNAPAQIETTGAGAELELRGWYDVDGRRALGPVVAPSPGATARYLVAPGAYQLRRGAVVLQLHVARGRSASIVLPEGEPPDGYALVPAGAALLGSSGDDLMRRDFLFAAPLHPVVTAGYLIGRNEVTFADWMTYLRALPIDERERRRPQTAPGRVMTMRLDGDGPFALTLQPSTVAYHAAEGELLRYPGRTRRQAVRWERVPVAGVSFDDARAYAAWLASTGRLPRARLCREAEWERAARGADGRNYPHGDRLEPDDANHDATYGRDPLGYGPDEVGAHASSRSPFGVDDLTGNVWEWVEGPHGQAMLRGGGWYHGASSALTMNRDFADPTMRAAWAGVRICADL